MRFPIIHRDRQRDGSAFLTVPSGQAAWVNQQGSVQQLAQITLHNQRDQPVKQTHQKPISLHPQIQDMSVKYKIRDQHGLNYLTCSVTGWVDLFARQVYRDMVLDSWRYCQVHKGFQVHAYTIMSNHLHLIASCKPPFRLEEVMRDWKAFTAT
jgi:hypothetical protein